MKVLEIAGCNLASLKGEFRIALDKAPLSGEGLFAIRGVTGSGKSTLIDAMCLALYDDTPRFVGKGGPEIGLADQKDRLKATDPRGIIHRGTAQGWAEVIFRGIDGVRWRARWSAARARKRADGRFQAQDMELENLDSGERLGSTRSEVLEHIRQKVGLTFDQFRRSVLLAQGEFAAFAKAGQDERANLLEAMTGTDIYARLSVAAQKRSAQEDQQLKELHIQREALGLMSEESRQAQELQVRDLEVQAGQQEHEQTEILRGLAWHERATLLERQTREADEQVRDAERAFREAEVRRLALRRVEQAQPLRAMHVTLGRSLEHQAALERQIQARQADLPGAERKRADQEAALLDAQGALRAAAEAMAGARPDLDAARTLDTRIQETQERVRQLSLDAERLEGEARKAEGAKDASEREGQTLTGKLTTVATELGTTRAHQALAQSWPRTEQDLEDFARTASGLQQAGADLKALRDTLQERQATRAAWQGELETRGEERSALMGHQDDLAQRMAEEPREVLEAARQVEQATLDGARQAQGILQRLQPLLSRHAEAEAEAKAQAAARLQAEGDWHEAQQSLPAVAGGLMAARAAWERAQDALSLEERRAHLVDGEPCPLCGALDHPWREGSPLHGLSSLLASQVAELEERRSRLEQSSAEARARMAEAAKAQGKAEKQATTHAADLRQEEDAWRAIRKQIPDLPEDGRSAHAQTVVGEAILDGEERLAGLGRRGDALLALEKQAEQTRRAARAVERQCTLLDGQLHDLDAEIQRLQVGEAAHAAKITNLESRRGELSAALAAILEREAMGALDRDPTLLRTRLGEAVARRLRAEASQADLQEKLAEVARVLEGQRATASERRTAAAGEAAKRDEAASEWGRLQEARKVLFEGRSILEVERGFEAQRKQCEEAVERARSGLQAADRDWNEVGQAIVTLQEQLEQARHGAATARSAFEEALAQAWEGDLSDLEACFAWTTEQIQAERETLQRLETAWTSAKAVLETHQRELNEHLGREKPVQAKEMLEIQAIDIKQSLDGLKRTLGGLLADLQRDDQARQHAETLALAIRHQDVRVRLWGEINALVGSSDGKKFRTFAQSLTLEALLAFANEQLGRLTPRYRLQRVPNCELEIQVIDQDMGDEIRALNSLSGGETFLVSLALALGLSSLSASDTPIESLFIDEGFGTLDSETLETALSVLDELQSQGRQVGIVSHVDGLATHIPVQILVEKRGGGRSRVVLPSREQAG